MFFKFLPQLNVTKNQFVTALKAYVYFSGGYLTLVGVGIYTEVCKCGASSQNGHKRIAKPHLQYSWDKVMKLNHTSLNPAKLQTYVDVITAKNVPLENCFGFIDATVRPITRPGKYPTE